MNNKNGISKTMLFTILSMGLVLLFAVAFINIIDSPKTYIPKYSKNIEAEETDEIFYNKDTDKSESQSAVFPIMINTATEEELQLIPDIGPVTAILIIEYRNEQGTILDFDELIVIDGIGKKTIEVLKEFCIIN